MSNVDNRSGDAADHHRHIVHYGGEELSRAITGMPPTMIITKIMVAPATSIRRRSFGKAFAVGIRQSLKICGLRSLHPL